MRMLRSVLGVLALGIVLELTCALEARLVAQQITAVAPKVATGNITTQDAGTCATTTTGCVVLIPGGYTTLAVQIGLSGGTSMTLAFESCLLNCTSASSWVPMLMTPPGTTASVTSTTASGYWVTNNPASFIRVRESGATPSGNATVSILGTLGGLPSVTIAAGSSAKPAGADQQFQFNNAGAFGANSTFTTSTICPQGSSGQIFFNSSGACGASSRLTFNPSPGSFADYFTINGGSVADEDVIFHLAKGSPASFNGDLFWEAAGDTTRFCSWRSSGLGVFECAGNIAADTMFIANGADGITSTVGCASFVGGICTNVSTPSGTGNPVNQTSPTLITPNLGTPSALTLTNATGLTPSTGLNATGTPSATTFVRGDNSWATIATAGRLIGVQVLTSSGTYTPTAGTGSVIVECQGGGGGGGGVASPGASAVAFGGGGGGGGWLMVRLTSNFSGATVTIGGAGSGGAAGNNAGGNGGDTTFTTTGSVTYTAGGGTGGFGSAGSGTAPQVFTSGSGGTISGTGTATISAVGGDSIGGCFSLSLTVASGCGGGASHYSGPQRQGAINAVNTSLAGRPASTGGKGGGGSGAAASGTGAAVGGGNGTAGVIIVYEFSS